MLFYTVVACILAFSNLVVCEGEAEIQTEGGVLVLTQDNFPTAIKENAYVLVEFCKYSMRSWNHFWVESIFAAFGVCDTSFEI